MGTRIWHFSALAALLLGYALPAAASAPAKVGVAGVVQDKVLARDATGKTRELKTGNDVFLGEVLTSDPKGKAQIIFLDKSALMINPSSEVVIDSFVYNPADSTGDMTIRNAKGALRFIGGVLSKDKPVTIKTPVSTIGIRGGIADTHVEKGGATDAIFVYGKEMTVENGKGDKLSVTEMGKGISVNSVSERPMPMPPGRIVERMGSFSPVPKGESGQKIEGQKAIQAAADGEKSSEGRPVTANGKMNGADTAFIDRKPGVDGLATLPAIENVVSNATQTNQRSTSGNAYSEIIVPDMFGSYALKTGNAMVPGREGLLAFGSGSGRFFGLLEEEDPTPGLEFTMNMQKPPTAGFFPLSETVSFDGSGYTGHAYASKNGAMYYYFLDEISGSREMAFAFGRPLLPTEHLGAAAASVTASLAAGTNNISFYSFLPDIDEYFLSGGMLGFFDYNTIDSRLIPPGMWTPTSNNPGLMVDWQNKQFLTAFVFWNNTPTTNAIPIRRDMMLGFGDVDTGALATYLLDGALFEFNRNFGTSELHRMDTGFIVDERTYGLGATSPVDGFLLTGIVDNRDILQPAMLNNGTAEAIAASSARTTSNTTGFAAGYVYRDALGAAGAPTVVRYWNTAPPGVSITKNAVTGSVGGTIAVFDTYSYAPTIDAYFGTSAAQPNIKDAFLANDLYAAQQGRVTYDAGGIPVTLTGAAATQGGIVGADVVAAVNNRCSSCQYVDWGVWAAEIDRGTVGGVDLIDVVSLIPYVNGTVTTNLTGSVVPLNLGNVTYNGAVYGTTLNGGALQRHDGTFAANINLNTRTLSGFDASFAGMRFGFTGAGHVLPTAGDATFTDLSVSNLGPGSPGDINGTINGALFGPQAQDIGGNFAVSHTNGTNGAGVYLGSR